MIAQLTLQYQVEVPKKGTVANMKEQVSLMTQVNKDVVGKGGSSSCMHVYMYMKVEVVIISLSWS